MIDRERADLEGVVADGIGLAELDQLERVAHAPGDPLERVEQVAQPRRPEHAQRRLALVEVVRLQQAGHAEVVVRVVVRQVDLVDLHEPGRALHLALRALAAVEQEPLAAGAHEHARGRAAGGGHRPAGAEEHDVEIHAATVAARL